MKKISNPSRTTKLEEHAITQDERIKALELLVKKQGEAIAALDKILNVTTLADEDTDQDKRNRAIREQGGVKYGD